MFSILWSAAAHVKRLATNAAVKLPTNFRRSIGPPKTPKTCTDSRRRLSAASRRSFWLRSGQALYLHCLLGQQLFADILQNVERPLDANLARQNRVLVFYAQNSFITHIHIAADDIFPCAGAVPVTNRAEGIRRNFEVLFLKDKVQHPVLRDLIVVKHRVFHMRVEDGALLAQQVNDFHWITALP